MLEEFLKTTLDELNISKTDAEKYPPLVLAYIGDAVYEVFVRTMLACGRNMPVHMLHERSVSLVKAKAQSDIIHKISGLLSEEEQDIVRRGRNAKSGSIPKNADVIEYKHATGFEALIGYLYLKGDIKRLIAIMKAAVTEQGG